MKNLNNIAKDLFNKIRGRFPSVTIGDADGTITNVPEDSRFYDFDFVVGKQKLGKVSVSLDEDSGITVIVGKDLTGNQPSDVQSTWFNFLRELRIFAKKRMLTFDVRDINKSNLTKRDYQFLAANRPGEKTMSESSMYGTNKTSYQRIGSARLAIKHSAPINTESASGRTQKISNIYIESPDGERFRYPFRHLSGARAMARHVSEGGNAYDDFGKYISSLSEELSKLRKFNTYMNRSGVMAETLSEYTDIVKERSNAIRKEIQNLQKENYYKEAVNGFTVSIVEDVPDDVAESWIDQLTIKQFNEELKDVFPYIYRLVGEASKAKEIGPEDLDETLEESDPCWKNYKQVGMKNKNGKKVPNCVPEEIEIENKLESLMGQFGETTRNQKNMKTHEILEASVPPNYMMARIINKKINPGQKSIGRAMGANVKGDLSKATNVKMAVFGHFQDPMELTDKTAEFKRAIKTPEDFIKAAQKVINDEWYKAKGVVLFFTEMEMKNPNWAPYISAIEELGDPAIQTNSRETRPAGDGSSVKVVRPDDDEEGTWGSADVRKSAPEKKKTYVFRLENDKLLNYLKKKQPDYVAKYYKPATNEFVMNQGTFEKFKATINSEPYVKKFGHSLIMVNNQKSFQEDQMSDTPKTPLGEFILSYFDRQTGKFPKGETAVLTAVQKDYGDQHVESARQFIEQIKERTFEYFQQEAMQSRYPETTMIKRLAGL